MDQVSAGKATRDGARTRRRRMREQARSQHVATSPVSDRYQTPEWLERSFVLPLTQPEASDVPHDVPSQPVPHHDDDAAAAPFVRPPSDDIDFGLVVRRSDLCRRAARAAWVLAGLAGLALIASLLTTSTLLLGTAVVLVLAATVALGLRMRMHRAPVPRLQR